MAWHYFERTNRPVPRFMRRPVAANDMIRRNYRPQTYEGNATLFKAELYAWNHPDAHDGWYELIKGKLEVRPISGRHYEIVKQPHVQTLARELSGALRKAQTSKSKTKRLRTV
jgi:thioesterase domain-containing protein